jgi:hypothetical protein
MGDRVEDDTVADGQRGALSSSRRLVEELQPDEELLWGDVSAEDRVEPPAQGGHPSVYGSGRREVHRPQRRPPLTLVRQLIEVLPVRRRLADDGDDRPRVAQELAEGGSIAHDPQAVTDGVAERVDDRSPVDQRDPGGPGGVSHTGRLGRHR